MSNQARQLLSPQDAGGRVGVGREGSHSSSPQKGTHRCGSHGHNGYVIRGTLCFQGVVLCCDVKVVVYFAFICSFERYSRMTCVYFEN